MTMNENKQCQGQNQEISPDVRQSMEEKNEKRQDFSFCEIEEETVRH